MSKHDYTKKKKNCRLFISKDNIIPQLKKKVSQITKVESIIDEESNQKTKSCLHQLMFIN